MQSEKLHLLHFCCCFCFSLETPPLLISLKQSLHECSPELAEPDVSRKVLLQLQQAVKSSNSSGTSNSQFLGTPRSTGLLQKNQMETLQSCFSLLKAHHGKGFPQGRATGQFCQATVTTGPGAPAEPAPLPALQALFPVLPPPAPCRRAGLFFQHPDILQPQHVL